MSAEYVRRIYGVDYKCGDRVTVDGKPGIVVSFPGQYLGVRFDNNPKVTMQCHPTWRVAHEGQPETDHPCRCPWCSQIDQVQP